MLVARWTASLAPSADVVSTWSAKDLVVGSQSQASPRARRAEIPDIGSPLLRLSLGDKLASRRTIDLIGRGDRAKVRLKPLLPPATAW
jgi:hypothetical protein